MMSGSWYLKKTETRLDLYKRNANAPIISAVWPLFVNVHTTANIQLKISSGFVTITIDSKKWKLTRSEIFKWETGTEHQLFDEQSVQAIQSRKKRVFLCFTFAISFMALVGITLILCMQLSFNLTLQEQRDQIASLKSSLDVGLLQIQKSESAAGPPGPPPEISGPWAPNSLKRGQCTQSFYWGNDHYFSNGYFSPKIISTPRETSGWLGSIFGSSTKICFQTDRNLVIYGWSPIIARFEAKANVWMPKTIESQDMSDTVDLKLNTGELYFNRKKKIMWN